MYDNLSLSDCYYYIVCGNQRKPKNRYCDTCGTLRRTFYKKNAKKLGYENKVYYNQVFTRQLKQHYGIV